MSFGIAGCTKSAGSTSPEIAAASQSSGAVGSPVTLTGNNFGATQGTSTVTFNGTAATAISWSNTMIVTTVPAGATTGPILVTVSGVPSNVAAFVVPAIVTAISQPSGAVGASITITGINFGATQGASTVTFGGIAATSITSWSATSIVAAVPAGALTGNITVTVSGVASNVTAFTVAPAIATLSQVSGAVGASVTITGTNFGATQGSSTISFNGTPVTAITSWSATSIVVTVPVGATTGNVVVTVGGVASNESNFVVSAIVTSLSQVSGAVGAPITISGSNFGAVQGASTVTFNGTPAAITTWSATSILAVVPAGAITGNVVVTVSGVSSNGVAFTVAPAISSLSQTSGAVGVSITITGSNFLAAQGASTITFNGTPVTTITSWSVTSIAATVPVGATTGNVVVTVGGLASNGSPFTIVLPPAITTLSQTSGAVGLSLTITGTNFGAAQGTSKVAFNGVNATAITSWSATSIVATVPVGAATGNVVVSVLGSASNGSPFTVVLAPAIISLSQTSGAVGVSVTVTGTSFGATQGASTITFNGTPVVTITSWTATSIAATVPAGATTGNVVVTVGGQVSNNSPFTVVLPPAITTLSQTSGAPGLSLTITGTNFGATQGTSSISFNGALVTTVTSWSATVIVATVPAGATTGNVVVVVLNTASSGSPFTVVAPPVVTSLSQPSGAVGLSLTITGTGFGATQGTSTVTFNGIAASTITSWSATSIVLPVPAGATTGNIVVTVLGTATIGANFTVILPPAITSLSAPSGAVGSPVTVTGTNFGATQGASTVTFDGTNATSVTSWSATSIVLNVPSDATSGNVVVTVFGAASNGSPFTITSAPGALCASGPTGSEGVLTGRWVVMLQGWQSTAPWPTASAFSFAASGTGSFVDVTGGGVTGNIDANLGENGATSPSSGNILTAGSTYKIGLDPTNNAGYVGCMTLASSTGGSVSLRFALSVTAGNALRGRIIQWTDTTIDGAGTRVSGLMMPQDATAFTNGNTTNLQASYAFGMDGLDPASAHYSIAGNIGLNTATGNVTSSSFDADDAGTPATAAAYTGASIVREYLPDRKLRGASLRQHQ
jgi:large repetitive protein